MEIIYQQDCTYFKIVNQAESLMQLPQYPNSLWKIKTCSFTALRLAECS